jgi:hypothetical protein
MTGDCPICLCAPADTVVCWNAHEICGECYNTCINGDRTNNKKCAICRDPMFKWEDATTDPVTGARATVVRLSTDVNANLNMAWIPENAGQNLFEMNEWAEANPTRPDLPVYFTPSLTGASERAVREYSIRWRVWAREMVRLGCPINTVEHYINNVLGGYILIEGLFRAHNYTFRVRTSRRGGTVWSVRLTPIDTNGFSIPWTHSILIQ